MSAKENWSEKMIHLISAMCLPNSRGQNGKIIYDPAKCDHIT